MNADQTNTAGGSAAPQQQEDYVDKALDAAEKKFGVKQDRNLNEKITDGARNLFEKLTGKKVSEKVSN